MDLILGPFSDARLGSMSASELDAYEALLEENDQDLYGWVSGRAGAGPDEHAAALNAIRGFHRIP